jgi:CheY-like chemotaxis protein
MSSKILEILLVEDNAGDARLMREAFKESKTPHHLHVTVDGVEGSAFLRRQGPWASQPRPDLIILDLNLPRKDGRELLAEIKQDPELKRIPVLVLTTSKSPQDILKCYDLHANGYIPKPVDLEEFYRVIKSIEDFWFNTAILPV